MSKQASLRSVLSEDEFRLAQLVCKKLPVLLQGAVSIGVGLLTTQATQAEAFLQIRFRALQAFVGVLSETSGSSSQWAAVDTLRQQAAQLADLLLRIEACLCQGSQDRRMLPDLEADRSLRACFDILAVLVPRLELDPQPIETARNICLETMAAARRELEPACV